MIVGGVRFKLHKRGALGIQLKSLEDDPFLATRVYWDNAGINQSPLALQRSGHD
jgi:hypothetical protein